MIEKHSMITTLTTFCAFWSFGYTVADLFVKIADKHKEGKYDE
jgi:hypothetical protein